MLLRRLAMVWHVKTKLERPLPLSPELAPTPINQLGGRLAA